MPLGAVLVEEERRRIAKMFQGEGSSQTPIWNALNFIVRFNTF
jgi:hypothetical protein